MELKLIIGRHEPTLNRFKVIIVCKTSLIKLSKFRFRTDICDREIDRVIQQSISIDWIHIYLLLQVVSHLAMPTFLKNQLLLSRVEEKLSVCVRMRKCVRIQEWFIIPGLRLVNF